MKRLLPVVAAVGLGALLWWAARQQPPPMDLTAALTGGGSSKPPPPPQLKKMGDVVQGIIRGEIPYGGNQLPAGAGNPFLELRG